MTKEEIKSKAEEIFTFLYKGQVSSSFRFPQGYSANILDKFADHLLKKEAGVVNLGLLVDYCIHQTYIWRDPSRYNNFSITWAFGPKAIGRFYDAKRGARYYQDLWLDKKKLSREELRAQFEDYTDHPFQKYVYLPAEETTKMRLHGTTAGFALCMTLTTLYAPQSQACMTCSSKKECERLIKTHNPELYRLRIENLK